MERDDVVWKEGEVRVALGTPLAEDPLGLASSVNQELPEVATVLDEPQAGGQRGQSGHQS